MRSFWRGFWSLFGIDEARKPYFRQPDTQAHEKQIAKAIEADWRNAMLAAEAGIDEASTHSHQGVHSTPSVS